MGGTVDNQRRPKVIPKNIYAASKKINEEVNKNLNLLILKDNKLQNRIYLKSLMNQAIKNYAG